MADNEYMYICKSAKSTQKYSFSFYTMQEPERKVLRAAPIDVDDGLKRCCPSINVENGLICVTPIMNLNMDVYIWIRLSAEAL